MSSAISNYALSSVVQNGYANEFPLYPEENYASIAITDNTNAKAASYASSTNFGGFNCIRMGLAFAFPQRIVSDAVIA